MATRIHFPSRPLWPLPCQPAYDAGWAETSISTIAQLPDRTVCTHQGAAIAKTANANTSDSGNSVGVAGPVNCLIHQFITPPLVGAQTITGTVKGQALCLETNAAANAHSQVSIRVFSGDGANERGVLLAMDSGTLASEWSTTRTNRKFPRADLSPATLSSVDAEDGDRIVIELGCRKHEAGTTSRSYNIRLGTNGGADLPEDETTTDNDDPWLEFSQDLVFADMGPRAGSMMLMGVGSA